MLTGMREPGFKKLILLANSLGCSVDYLLGLSSQPKRASVVVEADTEVIDRQSSKCEQTSGQISGKLEQFIAMLPELLEYDIELLMYLAGFFIEKKKKRLLNLAKAVAVNSEETEKILENSYKELKGRLGFDDCLPKLRNIDSNEEGSWNDNDNDLKKYDDEEWGMDFEDDDDDLEFEDDDFENVDDDFEEDFDD
jgi:hypothetical protein